MYMEYLIACPLGELAIRQIATMLDTCDIVVQRPTMAPHITLIPPFTPRTMRSRLQILSIGSSNQTLFARISLEFAILAQVI